jgi:molybdopterin converting factor subunit 1
MKLTVIYFAQLKDRSGRSSEEVELTGSTASDLYHSLDGRYHFGLERDHLRVAINEEYADWNSTLKDGDSVSFIPPVAGG